MTFTVAGTGSRELAAADQNTQDLALFKIKHELEHFKICYGSDLRVISGGAEGFDELLAKAALQMRIDLTFAFPNKGYTEYYWRGKSVTGVDRKFVIDDLVDKAKEVIYCFDGIYAEIDGQRMHANFARNQWMVNEADYMLVWDPKTRGTKDCFARIKKAGVRYTVLDAEPNTQASLFE